MDTKLDKIEQDFSDAAQDYVLDAGRTGALPDFDDESPTGELPLRAEKNLASSHRFTNRTDAAPNDDATSLKDVVHSISSYARHRHHGLIRFVQRHRIAVGILSILLLAAISALVVAFVRANDIPSVDAVTEDARTHIGTPDWTPGPFDADEGLVLTGIEVGQRGRTMTAISSDDAKFGATGYASAQVTTRYSGNALVAVKTSTLGYANVSGAWQPIGQEKDVSIHYEATSGVATQSVLDAHEEILKKLDDMSSTNNKAGSTSYLSTYGEGAFEIVDAQFDREKQTCSVIIKCTRTDKLSKTSFEARAHFDFDRGNGTWSLSGVEVAKAATHDYGNLVGSWTGTFEKTKSSDGGLNYSGRYKPFSLTITSAEFTSDSTVTITGTVSGVVHDHGPVAGSYRAYEGDAPFDSLPFSTSTDISEKGLLVPGGTISFMGAYPNGSKNPWITLSFNDADGTGTATVASYHTEDGATTIFTDTYTLTK